MSFTLSQTLLSSAEIGLSALSAVLDKAAAFASAKKIDESVLLNYRHRRRGFHAGLAAAALRERFF